MSKSDRNPPARGPRAATTREPRRSEPGPAAAGLEPRRAAVAAIEAVLAKGRPLEEALERLTRDFEPRDRALSRMIAASVLRRLGSLRALIADYLDKPLPERARHAETLLLVGAAQILLMDVPDHAAVATSVELAGEDAASAGYKGLINAVLRRIAREGGTRFAALAASDLDLPEWLMAGWVAAYGAATAHDIAQSLLAEPPLDLTVAAEPETWAERLGGRLLPTGSVRLVDAGNVTALPGFSDGAWWVQDAAAALPARLLGVQPGMSVADLCAAPGGKTAQLALAGARVTAVDRSGPRLRRLAQNLARLNFEAAIVEADATAWTAPPFEAVLLDAPCSSTGTLRRHPDVAWSKLPEDIASLAALQERLLDHAADLVTPGGLIVYSTCSLEPEEGERQIERLLARRGDLERVPVTPGECGIAPDWINAAGEVRTLPCHLADPDPRLAGLDGFFAARLRRRSI